MAKHRGRRRRRRDQPDENKALARRVRDNVEAIESLHAKSEQSKTALDRFYDDHQTVMLAAVTVGAGAAGVQMNKRIGPVTSLGVQPSTMAAGVCGAVALVAHQKKMKRATRMAVAATIGMIGATAATRAQEGGLLSGAGAARRDQRDQRDGDRDDDVRGADDDDDRDDRPRA